MTAQQMVAAEVRAELARQQLSGVRAAKALGWTQYFLSVRLRGAVAFDVNDLQALADLLDVPVTQFFQGVGGRGGLGSRVRTPGFSPALGRAA